MYYHVFLTRHCNLQCVYCGEAPESHHDTPEIQYSLKTLQNFLTKDPHPTIAFYGGEPLLRIPLMKQILDLVPAEAYILQTNGIFLSKLESKYLRRFSTILVSIDGRKATTNYYRGDGVYESVLQNVQSIRARDFTGDLVARMSVSARSNIYEEVRHLLDLGLFDHVHWQLDFFWSADGTWKNEDLWIHTNYFPGIARLANDWINQMETSQLVPGIVPFQGIMHTLLTGTPASLRCGSGLDFFAIAPSGAIYACPITIGIEDFLVGDIFSTSPPELLHMTEIGEPCLSCNIYWVCGGRCLFVNGLRDWDIVSAQKICETVNYLVQTLQALQPRIEQLLHAKHISLDAFHYPQRKNGCEVIP